MNRTARISEDSVANVSYEPSQENALPDSAGTMHTPAHAAHTMPKRAAPDQREKLPRSNALACLSTRAPYHGAFGKRLPERRFVAKASELDQHCRCSTRTALAEPVTVTSPGTRSMGDRGHGHASSKVKREAWRASSSHGGYHALRDRAGLSGLAVIVHHKKDRSGRGRRHVDLPSLRRRPLRRARSRTPADKALTEG